MRVFGPSEFAVRLPSVLAFCATLSLIVVWGNRRLGKGIGTLAAVVFALSPLAMLLGRLAITDMLLTCCLMIALVALWEAATRPAWSILWGAATGLAVLAKGPVGLGLVTLQVLISLPLLRKRGLRLRWALVALVIAVLVPLPWYGAVLVTHGQRFFQDFLMRQNLLRFAGGDRPHAIRSPALYLLYYVLIVWIGVFPSSLMLPKAAENENPVYNYLRRWCWLVFVFFTLAVTKLPAYVFPMFPALALLVEGGRSERRDMVVPPWARRSLATAGALVWLGITVTLAVASRNPLPVLFGIGLAASAVWFPTPENGQDVTATKTSAVYRVLALLSILAGLHFALGAYDTVMLKPIRALAATVPAGRELVVYKVPRTRQTLDFYRDGRVNSTDDEDTATQCLVRGDYCLAHGEDRPAGDWKVVRKTESLGQVFVLLEGGRTATAK